MRFEAQVDINAPKAAVWATIADIENAAANLSGIDKIEIVEKPPDGLVGLKWRETRMYFGKPATVEISITDAVENDYYKAQSESDGFLFLTTMTILENDGGGTTLNSSHDSQPQGFVAKLKSAPMFLFKGVVKKALLKDLNDIKTAAERGTPSSA